MMSRIAEALKSVSCSALLVCVVAACGDGEKPVDAKAGVLSVSSTKTGLSQAAIAGQLATGMVNGEAEKSTTRMGPLGLDLPELQPPPQAPSESSSGSGQ